MYTLINVSVYYLRIHNVTVSSNSLINHFKIIHIFGWFCVRQGTFELFTISMQYFFSFIFLAVKFAIFDNHKPNE